MSKKVTTNLVSDFKLAGREGEGGNGNGRKEIVKTSPPFHGDFFLRVLRFSSFYKNQHFQIPIRPGNSG